MLAAFVGLDHRSVYQFLDESKAHVRNGRGAVKPTFRFHLHNDVLQHLLFVFIQGQRIHHPLVTLHQFCGGEANRDPGGFRVVVDQMHDRVKAAMHRTAVIVHIAKISPAGLFLILGHMQRMTRQFIHTLVLGCGNGNHRDTQHGLHLIDADRPAIAPYLVHHIQRQHHRNIQLQQLHGQIQVTLNIGGVHNIDDTGRFLIDNKLPCNDLLVGIGRHGIDAGQIRELRIGVFPDSTALAVHCHAREVAHMLI